MTEDEILQATKLVLQTLDTLKNEYEKILQSSPSSSQIHSLRESMDMIDLGIDEAQLIMQLDYHLQILEAEKHKLRAQVKRLCQENAWLRDELGSTQKKFHECEQINASFSVEIEHFKFLKDVKQIDEEDLIINNQELMNDLFPFDDQDQSEDGLIISSDDQEIPTRLKTLHSLVIQYAMEGRHEVAVPLCRQALQDLEKTVGHQHPDVATMLNILALIYRDQSKFKEAIVVLQDALSIREKIFGSDHPAVAATLNNLAVLYSKRNKFEEAEPLCQRALEIREKCLGSSHPDVAKQLTNLALLYQNLGKLDQVELCYKRTIDIYTQSLGYQHAIVTKTMNDLASAYLKQQKYKEAEQLYIEILTHTYDKDPPSILKTTEHNHTQGHWYKSIRLGTPAVIATLKNLSSLYRQQGQQDAADILENCLSHARNDSPSIIQTLDILKHTNNLS